MLRAKSDLIRSQALRAAFSALFFTGCINTCFAQSEPPLIVPLAGRLPGPGCDAGLGGNSLYGDANLFGGANLNGSASLNGNISPAVSASPAGNFGLGGITGPAGSAGLGSITTPAGNIGLGGITAPAGNAGLGNITSPAGNIGLGGITAPAGNAGRGGIISPADNAGLGGNVPLSSNDSLYGNVPLYGNAGPSGDIALYSNSSLYNNSNLGSNSSLGSYPSPGGTVASACRSAIPIGGWLLYPSIRMYSAYSDNLFLSPIAPVKALGIGASPSLTAQWTNGIHTTTIYANFDSEIYPTDNMINSFNREVTVTQKYAPLPDLTFTALGDYTHQTISSSLTNSIPNAISVPPSTPTRLANGDIALPNGQIVSPSGQIVGQTSPVLAYNGISLVNPYDQYTGTATVSKIFNRGILTLSGSLADTNYESIQGTGPTAFTYFTTKTFTETGAFWLGPVLYAYSDGAFSLRANNEGANANSDAYRVVAGIGTRQLGEFRSSLYFGHQGSEVQNSGTAGGDVYGGKISYYPTPAWTITAAIDETINISSQTAVSTQALSLSANTPIQVPLSSSTRTTNTSVNAQYTISPQWRAVGTFGYTRTEYLDSPRLDNAWLADVVLKYDIWRNMTLTWEYQYSSIVSNAELTSAKRNLFTMSANYRF
jgi:hypothetical protein